MRSIVFFHKTPNINDNPIYDKLNIYDEDNKNNDSP